MNRTKYFYVIVGIAMFVASMLIRFYEPFKDYRYSEIDEDIMGCYLSDKSVRMEIRRGILLFYAPEKRVYRIRKASDNYGNFISVDPVISFSYHSVIGKYVPSRRDLTQKGFRIKRNSNGIANLTVYSEDGELLTFYKGQRHGGWCQPEAQHSAPVA